MRWRSTRPRSQQLASGDEFRYAGIVSIQELETAITRLSKEELATFSRWFEEYTADEWDRQIEADIRAGRFDAAGKRAKADYEAGRCTPL